jgi:GT2 family glycosyltransferase
MARIGLVTVLYNSDELLEGFFKSIASQSFKDYILYLIDNSVNETTNKLIGKYLLKYPLTTCRHIKNADNIGVAAGNNAGIHLALNESCQYVLLLNNDIETEQDYVFSKLLELAEEKGETMIVPKILYYSNRKLWMAGGYMNKWRALGIHYGMGKKDVPEYNKAKHITYAPTCFMLIQKQVFEKIGYMDEQYFAYYDDTDFVFRATKAGFRLFYEPSLTILHKVSSSVGGNSPFYVYYSNRNKIYFIRKNLKGINRYFSILYTLIIRIFFWLRFDAARRKKLVQGLREGFRLSVQ